MYTEPGDLDRAALTEAMRRHWQIDATRLDYLPVGFGSHHWDAAAADGARWFVSADDLLARQHAGRSPDDVFAALDRAFRTAAALRDAAALDFVLAPVPSVGGKVLCRFDTRYAIRVEPFVEGVVEESGDFSCPDDRRAMGTLLGRLHAASEHVAPDLRERDDCTLPGRAGLETALAGLDARWDGGPFAEPTRALLRVHAEGVGKRLLAFDRLAARLRTESGPWVVTHGEPHSANVIRTPDGGLRLVDWDTALVAPRERDLWMTLDGDMTGWDEYREATGAVRLNEQALAFYRERWALAEICMYVTEFRRPHEESDDTRASWAELGEYLS